MYEALDIESVRSLKRVLERHSPVGSLRRAVAQRAEAARADADARADAAELEAGPSVSNGLDVQFEVFGF